MERAFCFCYPLSGALSAPKLGPSQTSHLIIVSFSLREPRFTYLIISFLNRRKPAHSTMNPSDFQPTVRVYSTEVDQRLPPGHEAHDLGQALVLQVNSEIPVPSKYSLIRGFFEKDSSDNGR